MALVDEQWWRDNQDDYLAAATRVWVPESPLNVLDHLEWRSRTGNHVVDTSALVGPVTDRWFARIDHWLDCADFDVLRLLHLWYRRRDELPSVTVDALAERFAGFRYWFTDPKPEGVVDQRWYWSENHRLIFHTCEYLAGQAFPDVVFTAAGITGEDHRARAMGRLSAWFDEKATEGFSEWHSDVYYVKDLAPLLTLAELADDEALAERAAAFLDLLLFDVALHLQRGNMGSTHGRSYAKDKTRAVDQPMFAPAKLCFADSDRPWPMEGDGHPLLPRNEGATLLAQARCYRPPEVLRSVARSRRAVIDCEGMGLAIDPEEPFVEHPTRPDGLGYDDPDLVAFWWDRGALTPWQLVPLTLATMDRHELWEADLFALFRPVRELTGADPKVTQRLAADLAPMLNPGLLASVDTTTYRTEHVMLSTAQSYRPGRSGFQHHIWQATLDEDAVVFTTHPGNEPWEDPTAFADLDRYWTGSATLPRSLQHGAAAVHQYMPAFASPGDGPLAAFSYLEMTHAWFPSEHFDEVVRDGNWTLGRKGHGYVALWSWRPVEWRSHDPARVYTAGMKAPFDLVAPGGACNVWIVEVSDVDHHGSFADFRSAIVEATVEVDDLGYEGQGGGTRHQGFRVRYDSPGEGEMTVQGHGPLSVDGVEVTTSGYPRFENPWTLVARGETTVAIRDPDDGSGWIIDLAAGTRQPLD